MGSNTGEDPAVASYKGPHGSPATSRRPIRVAGPDRCSSYLFSAIDDMIFIPLHGVQKHSGCLWNRGETDHDPGGICRQCLDHFGKQLPWHHLTAGTQEVQLEITEGRHRLVY